ncbi:MAG: tRNA-uridine aminocarboxypropyltransferase [Ghiorsea sp.]
MNIYLLTHQRELERKTNTGQLVAEVLENHCKVFMWERTSPNLELLNRIKHENIALVYPCEGSVTLNTKASFESIIIIDATWQEAQKMYNHSPYLKDLEKITLNRNLPSVYTLRRNQRSSGLCTAECAVEILNHCGNQTYANLIEENLTQFILNSNK